MTVQDALIQDCSAKVPLTQSITLSEAFQRSQSIALNHSIQNTESFSLNFGVSSGIYKMDATLTFGTSETAGTVKTDTDTATTTRAQSGSTTLQPGTAEVGELRIWPVQYTEPFHTTVVVDADLSNNDKGYHHLSDILDGPSRTFDITGHIEADDASIGQLVFYDSPYDPSICGSKKAVLQQNYVPKDGSKLTRRSD
jgi:hypothetical protein